MASRLTWPAIVAGALVLVALLVYGPLDPTKTDEVELIDERGELIAGHPLVRRVNDARMELRTARALHFEREALAMLRDALPAEPAIVVARLPESEVGTPAGDRGRIAAQLRHRLRSLNDIQRTVARATPHVRAAIVEVESPFDTRAWSGYENPSRVFAGVDSLGAWCGTTFTYAWNVSRESPLGPCRMWTRFGPPSPQVAAWLAGGAHVLALPHVAIERHTDPRRLMFGTRSREYDDPLTGLKVDACLAGREDACLPGALDIAEWSVFGTPPSRLALMAEPRFPGTGLLVIGGLFGEIEEQIGRERMRAIWTGSADPRADLEAALGRDLDEWLMDWMRHYLGEEPLGPIPDANSLVRSLLMIAVLVGTGLWTASRRQIG